ncbi:dual oxidase maturation factor 1-like [Scleropages formosus]|uniref:Dual oxidase maturation factor 1-like n=1 Tax=Scleropages formosus TaxID=113540 RepID=A0A0P7VDI4_SCLFO|nr:dual oxidase maturation factor 1-like [Scleropages formosus]
MTLHDDVYALKPRPGTPFVVDGELLTVTLVFSLTAAAFLLIIPGIRGKLRLFWMCRIFLSLFIGVVMVAVQFSSSWASALVRANTTYKSFSSTFVNAEVGLHVGLSGINITLKGNPVVQLNETINYNEAFYWRNNFEEDYAEALEKGLPTPILYIAEKFTHKSPCGFYSQYRYSGRYASATMWTAFCCWLVTNILLSMPVLLYAGCLMVASGAFMFFSLTAFATAHNLSLCTFTVDTASFQTSLSTSFWLALATGVLSTVTGVLVVVLDYVAPGKLRETFGVSAHNDNDDIAPLGVVYHNNNFLMSPLPAGTPDFAVS